MAPKFWEECAAAYRASTAYGFVLYGDGTQDYPENTSTVDLLPWLHKVLVKAGFDLVITYDPATGITFPVQSMRQLFLREVMNADSGEQRKGAVNPALAAMLGQTGTSSSEDVDLRLQIVDALPLLDKAMNLVSRTNKDTNEPFRVAVIFSMANLTFPANTIGPLPPAQAIASAYIQNWLRDPRWRAQNAPMIWWITPSLADVSDVLRNAYAVAVSAPGYEDRKAFAEYCLAANEVKLADDMTVHRLAAMTAGLLRLHIEDVIVRARVEGVDLTAEMVKERKDQIMRTRFAGVLETVEATGSLDDIAGLEYLKRFLLSEIVEPMKRGDTEGMPMGVLMAGPPGTGKTYIAEKLAASAGVNFILFRMSNILGSFVGESERNLEKALQGIQEMTPAIVFVDEVEQSIRRDTGGSGNSVMGNIFGRLLNAMGDSRNRGKVVWLMATNRPDLLDPAFKRSGRIDAKFAVMPPDSDEERAEMFKVMARKNRLTFASDVDLSGAASACVDYTGADIEVIVLKAGKLARAAGRSEISQADLDHAVKAIRIPQNEQTRMMIAMALAEVNDLDNLPPSYRARYEAGEFDKRESPDDEMAVRETRRSGRSL